MSGKKTVAITGCTKKEGAAWVSVKKLGSPDSIAGSIVTLTGPGSGGASVTQTADHLGLVQFTGLKPGKYNYSVALPGAKLNSLKFETHTGALAVSRGEVAAGGVEAYPVGTLNVRVVDDSIPPQVIANVSLSGAGGESVQRPYGAGTHSFANVRAGNYTVTAMAGHMTRYAPREATSVAVAVPEGGAATALIVLQVSNTATPVIDLQPAALPKARNEAWFVKPADTTQATAAGFVEVPLELRFSFNETNAAKPFIGGGVVSFGPAIKLYRDAAMTLQVPGNSLQVTHAELAGTLRLYAKGAAAGSAQVRLALDTPPAGSGILIDAAVSEEVLAKEVVKVEPKVELEYKVVVFDRDLAQYQTAAGELPADLLRPSPTRIELAFTRSAGAPPPYLGDGTLVAANCIAYTDAACTLPLGARKLTNAELGGGAAMKLHLRGATRGLFNLTLTLDPSTDSRLFVALHTPEPMGVVEVQVEIYQHLTPVVLAVGTYPLTGHCADLERADLIPDQVILSDNDKAIVGRVLHKQSKKHHDRAKVIVKLTAGEWPAGTDDYDIVLESDHDGLKAHSLKIDGVKQALPFKVKVSALTLAQKELWIEGAAVSATIRSKKLSVGVDRAAGGLAKTPITHADWGRFTVVQIDSVKLEYTEPAAGQPKPWNASKHRWYINYQAGDAGRTVKIRARLTKPIAGIRLHFMLTPDKDNLKEKNWGIDLPATWAWAGVSDTVKQKDKTTPTDLLHLSELTDAQGKADKDLVLSQFGGDVFKPAAYIDQDPHLAAYIHGHATLEERKPALCDHRIKVWRKFAYQMIRMKSRKYPNLKGAEDAYGRLRAEMVKIRPSVHIEDANFNNGTLGPLPMLWPEYMVKVGGGTKSIIMANLANLDQFFAGLAADAENPVLVPVAQADHFWGYAEVSSALPDFDMAPADFPLDVTVDRMVCNPPMQGGDLLATGTWTAAEHDAVTNTWINVRHGAIANADLSIDKDRDDLKKLTLALPAIGATDATTVVAIRGLSVKGGRLTVNGCYRSGVQQLVLSHQPTPAIWHDTAVHELGHAFYQVPTAAPVAGIPAHPNQYIHNGSHCNHAVNLCIMYQAAPIAGSLKRFCDICHPYVLAQDMSHLK